MDCKASDVDPWTFTSCVSQIFVLVANIDLKITFSCTDQVFWRLIIWMRSEYEIKIFIDVHFLTPCGAISFQVSYQYVLIFLINQSIFPKVVKRCCLILQLVLILRDYIVHGSIAKLLQSQSLSSMRKSLKWINYFGIRWL